MKEKVYLPEADYQKQAMSLEQYLIRHCAPTLASLKTANLFPVLLENNLIFLTAFHIGMRV